MKTLNCREPHLKPRATEHIPQIIALIEKLLTRGIAYQAADRSVYFSIEKYRGCGCHYGQLLKLNFDEMRAGERVKSDEYAKESIADFALWKSRVPEDGDVFWPSPFGEGRPGWHIECSAMSTQILGDSFDLHLGGEDLIFPHHEDEIAQSEGATGNPFVKYWLHGAHLLVEGKKMSKSLGNFFTLRDLLAKGYTGREVRYLLLSAHYRETFNFTLDGLQGAKASLARIDECVSKLRELTASSNIPSPSDKNLPHSPGLTGHQEHPQPVPSPLNGERVRVRGEADQAYPTNSTLAEFTNALDNDLNISAAWGTVFTWVTESNKRIAENSMSPADAATALTTWEKIDSVLGIGNRPDTEIPPGISSLLDARQAARKAKDFKKSDAIRDELKSKGWTIEDTAKGPKLKKI
jgi:cysteinyl-tRNA synthetase